MALVVSGRLNKQVGWELGISEITVKAHRGQVMQEMKANSLADLVRMAAQLEPAHKAIHSARRQQAPVRLSEYGLIRSCKDARKQQGHRRANRPVGL
jgi:DNA-binding NarL/FixJ family response regulator